MNENLKGIMDFIGDSVTFDEFGCEYLYGNSKDGQQMIAEVRGWGAIQNLFKLKGGGIDNEKAEKFQNDLGKFIAEAITEKLQRERELLKKK